MGGDWHCTTRYRRISSGPQQRLVPQALVSGTVPSERLTRCFLSFLYLLLAGRPHFPFSLGVEWTSYCSMIRYTYAPAS